MSLIIGVMVSIKEKPELKAFESSEHPPDQWGKLSEHVGQSIGCKDKNS